jgi:hypothetical protein
MQPLGGKEEHRQQEGDQRDEVEHQRMAHERYVFADLEKFHLATPAARKRELLLMGFWAQANFAQRS